jgi:hypothetical protein
MVAEVGMIEVDEDAMYRAIYKWEEDAPIQLLLDLDAYEKHFRDEYGIAVSLSGNRVVDEQKYLMFILRWA